MQVLDDLRAGFVDVKVLQLAPELVQVDTTARGNFAGKFGFWYRPLNSDDIIPFLRHVDVGKAFLKTHGLVQLICWCFIWVLIYHVSPLRCPENYWVHVIVSLKQDASTLRMLSEFWRVNPTRGVTMLSCSLSLSTISEQTTSIRGGYFKENYKWGHPRHLRNFYAIHKKSITAGKKTRPPLILLIDIITYITHHMLSNQRQRLLHEIFSWNWIKFFSFKKRVTSRVRVEVFSLISRHAIFSLRLLSFTDN